MKKSSVPGFTPVTRRFHTYPDTTGKRQAEGGRRCNGVTQTRRPGAPLVTIITVCLNSAKTIEKTIQSVRAQTFDNIEYVVVDGASNDGTIDIVRRNDDIVDYYISEPDEGLYHAINKGLGLSNGDYIIILNSDDWYESQAISRLVSATAYSGCDFVGSLARYVNDQSKSSYILRTMPFDYSVLLRMPLRHETMLIPADLYDRVGAYDTSYRVISDYEFAVRLFQAGATYYEVPEALLNFRTSGVSNTDPERLNTEARTLSAALFPFLTDADRQAMTDHAKVNPDTFIALANAHLNQPDFVRACRSLLVDRKAHSGPVWQRGNPDAVAADAAQAYPKVSVVIPFYEAADCLAATLDNVLSQSLREIEVICVNDCAVDGSQAIVDAYCAKDARVKSLKNGVNAGPGASRNAGIRAARGRYVFFLDADDSVAEGALETLYDSARRHGSAIVRGAFRASQRVHGQAGNDVVNYPCNISDRSVVNTTLAEMPQLLASTEGHWAALYDADFALKILYPTDIRVGEDSFFLVKAYALAPTITLVPTVVYHYQANPNSAMNNLTAPKYFNGLTWRRRAGQVLRDVGLTAVGEHLLFNFWSEPYFDRLEKVLTEDEKKRYFTQLSDAFAEYGHADAGAVRNQKLRQRILTRFEHYRAAGIAVPDSDETGTLRIATLSTQDHGGAGIGSQRRVEALRKAGVDAHIYCVFQNTGHAHVHKVPLASSLPPDLDRPALGEAWTEQAVLRQAEHPGLEARELFSKTGTVVDFRKLTPVFDDADVVHMHWVCGMLDYEHLGETLGDKPVAWTLADMNAFTGGCHYSEGCTGYRDDCRNCPLLESGSTLAHEAWTLKRKAYAGLKNLHVICPSQWLADRVRESALLGDRPVHVIPNAFPVDRFMPTNKIVAREQLGLPLDKKLIVFGADCVSNRRKGDDILRESLKHLAAAGATHDVEGLFFGPINLELDIKTHHMGRVSDDRKLSLIYAAADVFAFPSREDNAPLTVAEAMLSATPVVAFPVGNVAELVTHLDTGYIAEYENAQSFAQGLEWALKDPRSEDSLMRGLRAHLVAKAYNDPTVAADRHVQVYRAIVPDSPRASRATRRVLDGAGTSPVQGALKWTVDLEQVA